MHSMTLTPNVWESTGMHILNIFSLDKQIKGDTNKSKHILRNQKNSQKQRNVETKYRPRR